MVAYWGVPVTFPVGRTVVVIASSRQALYDALLAALDDELLHDATCEIWSRKHDGASCDCSRLKRLH